MTKSRNSHAVKTRDLYGSSSVTNDEWNFTRYMLADVGAFGFYPFKMWDEYQFMSDYLKNRGLSWSDMKYPALAKNSGVGAKLSVSKNIEKLYR